MSHIIIDKAKADSIRGKWGKYSAIEPVLLPDGNYIVPIACISDPDLVTVKTSLEWMDDVVQQIVNLPEVGQPVEGGKIYRYSEGIENGYSGLVIAVRSHTRMDFKPEDTPALFTFYRENSDDLEWIPNEKVDIGYKRMYGGKQYEVVLPHMTVTGWGPDKATTLWKEIVVVNPDIKPPQWVTSDWAKYTPIGFEVYDNGKVWRAKNTTHTWIQPALTGDGAISWEYVKDWI